MGSDVFVGMSRSTLADGQSADAALRESNGAGFSRLLSVAKGVRDALIADMNELRSMPELAIDHTGLSSLI